MASECGVIFFFSFCTPFKESFSNELETAPPGRSTLKLTGKHLLRGAFKLMGGLCDPSHPQSSSSCPLCLRYTSSNSPQRSMVNAGWLCFGEGFADTDTCPWAWEPQRSQSLFNNIKSSSRWSRWNTLRLLVMRLKVRLGLKSVNGASLIFWNGSCPLFLRSCLLWCLRLRCYTKEKLCGKFSMCWYVSWNNGCFDMTGAETLILASFMCHSQEWKNDEIAFHVNSQKKHMPDAQLFRLRPAFLWHCVCWWNIGLYCPILNPTPQCIHQRRKSSVQVCVSLKICGKTLFYLLNQG